MDPITQVLLGAAVGHATLGSRVGRKAMLWGAVLGGVPDLDVFIPQPDAVEVFTDHRGFTHSLVTHTVVAPVIGAALARLYADDGVAMARWSLLAWLALVTHALLDAVTIYGTQLFWPATSPPVGVGSIFIIDPVYTLVLLTGVLWAVFARHRPGIGRRVNAICLGLGTAYLALGMFIQAAVRDIADSELARQGVAYDRLLVTPTPFNLVLWRVVAMAQDGYREGYYSLLDESAVIRFSHYPSDQELLTSIENAPAVTRLRWFIKGFYRVREVDGVVAITDLRMGYEPRYVFSFLVGQRQNGDVREQVPPERAPAERPELEDLNWLWRRMLGDSAQPLSLSYSASATQPQPLISMHQYRLNPGNVCLSLV